MRQALEALEELNKASIGVDAVPLPGEIDTAMDAMVNRFLTWPVPASVYPDGTPGQPGRTGTNLLNASEARQMLEHVLATPPAAPRQWVGLTDEEIMETVGQITTYRDEYEVAVGHAIEAKLKEKNNVL
jgi:hypothetical protein